MAGALHLQLAGDAWYFGQRHEKPLIGDPLRPAEPEDILKADRLLYISAGLGLFLFGAVRAAVLLLLTAF